LTRRERQEEAELAGQDFDQRNALYQQEQEQERQNRIKATQAERQALHDKAREDQQKRDGWSR
jgi:hypothetical protein